MTTAKGAKMRLPLIIASTPGEIIDVKAKSHKCKDGQNIVINCMAKAIDPFSGKPMKIEAKADSKGIPAKIVEELPVIASCPECSCEMRSSAEMATFLSEKPFFCVACGASVTGNKIAPEIILAQLNREIAKDGDVSSEDEAKDRDDEDEDDADEDFDDDGDDDDDGKDDAKSTEAKLSIEENKDMTVKTPVVATTPATEPQVLVPPEVIQQAEKVAETIKAETTPVEVKVETPVVTPEPEKVEAKEVKAEVVPPVVEVKVEEPKTEPTIAVEPKVEQVQIQLSKLVNWVTAQIHLVRATLDNSSIYYIFANGKPVGTLKQTLASDNLKEIFNTEKFCKGFTTAATSGLTDEDAKNFGMEPLVTEISVDEHVTRQIEDAKKSAENTIQSSITTFKSKHNQALSTAVLGTVKGLFNEKNALRDGLVVAFGKLGVVSPEKIIDSALAAHAPDFFRDVMTKANELVEASDESRNSIAKMVATASFRSGNSAKAQSLSETLSQVGTPVVELASSTTITPEQVVTAGNKGGSFEDNVQELRKVFAFSSRH